MQSVFDAIQKEIDYLKKEYRHLDYEEESGESWHNQGYREGLSFAMSLMKSHFIQENKKNEEIHSR